MASWDIFEHQTQEYRDSVLPPECHCADRDRAGLHVRMGAIRRGKAGRVIGMNDIRGLGAAEGAAAEIRVRADACDRGCKGTPGSRMNRCLPPPPRPRTPPPDEALRSARHSSRAASISASIPEVLPAWSCCFSTGKTTPASRT